jgi:SpoIID/LytB domain protein
MNRFRRHVLTGIFFPILFLLIGSSPIVFGAAPAIRLKVAEYPAAFTFSLPSGGTWELGKHQGKLGPKDTFRVTTHQKSPAIIKYHVIVESAARRDQAKCDAALAKWRASGRPIHTLEYGKQSLAADGKTVTYDGRVLFIGVGHFMTREPAQKLVDELSSQSQSSWVMEEVLQLAKGTISLMKGKRVLAKSDSALLLQPHGLIRLKQVEHARGFSWHGYADRSYRAPMTVQFGARNALDCILRFDLETMLAGVVPSEISSRADPAALCAQAVAARGEILAKMGIRHLNEGFNFCSEQHCQVYSGETEASIRVGKAIAPTFGLLLQGADGGIIDAVYSANCGGHTEPNHLVWTSSPDPYLAGTWDIKPAPALDLTQEEDVRPYILGTPAAFCHAPGVEGGDKFRWSKTLTKKDWKEVENRGQVGRIKDITDLERGPSGRLFRLTLVGKTGKRTIMKELTIRKLFGMLRSACFIADWKKDAAGFIAEAEFHGAGWGHGVGMCQTGAQNMARQGFSYEQILAHYFPGSLLKKFY